MKKECSLCSKWNYYRLRSSIPCEKAICITEENVSQLPDKIAAILAKWLLLAETVEEEFEKQSNICPVKFAKEIFRYEDTCYMIYPRFFEVSEECFEYMMCKRGGMEEDLKKIGATQICCTAMCD